MTYVLKIMFGNTIRRLLLHKNGFGNNELSLSFAQLETRIRELFQLPAGAQLEVTYADVESDIVTMGSDEDLKDALIEQSLNPLRLHVTLAVKTKSRSNPSLHVHTEKKISMELENFDTDVLLKRLFEILSRAYEGGSLPSPAQFSGVIDFQSIISQLKELTLTDAKPDSTEGSPYFAARSGFPKNVFERLDPPMMKTGSGAADASPRAQFNSIPSEFRLPVDAPVSFPDFDTGFSLGPMKDVNVHHHGVICDVCGVAPILGLRWKSNWKFDYDLCSSCFEKHGNEEEYTKIEQPQHRTRHSHGRVGNDMPSPFGPSPFGPVTGHQQCGPMMSPGFLGSKLDARLVCHVTMVDGTEVAPGTHFTKTWRLRNTGTAPWPRHTSLVHTGGDELGHVSIRPLEIQDQCLAPEEETEASVDLVAPMIPGRYISHWRLASPAGTKLKFGQLFSVCLQVVTKDSTPDQPTESVDVSDESATDEPKSPADVVNTASEAAKVTSADGGEATKYDQQLLKVITDWRHESGPQYEQQLLEAMTSWTQESPPPALETGVKPNWMSMEVNFTEAEKSQMLQGGPHHGDEHWDVNERVHSVATDTDSPISNCNIFVQEEKLVPPTVETCPADVDEGQCIEYPKLEVTPDSHPGPITYPAVNDPAAAAAADFGDAQAAGPKVLSSHALLEKLDAMGFTDSKLNLELLEKNNLDLRKTLDDLCTAEEWDPILDELEEMGFYDTDTNRRLMFKNNGSVKLVVKELVQMYRDLHVLQN